MNINIFKDKKEMAAEIERLENKVKGQEDLLKRRTQELLKAKEDLEICTQGYNELKLMLSAYFAYITHKNGGRLNLQRKKINELMGKYNYEIEITDQKFIFKEKR